MLSRGTFLVGTLWCVGLAGCTAPPPTPNIYQDDLTSPRHWSEDATAQTPDVGEIRGPFTSQTVTLAMNHLPEHRWIRVRFNLFIRGTWDGSSNLWGPDLWSLTSRGGPRLIFASICNLGFWANNNAQSFPDDYTAPVVYPARTGAAPAKTDLDTFAATHGGLYTTYPVEVVFPHTGPEVNLDFEGIYDDPQAEQAWGLNNVTVEALSQAPVTDASLLPGWWNDLASADGVTANKALWNFVGAGDLAVAFLENKLAALKAGTEPSPKMATGVDQKLQGLRLRRADRIARILLGPTSTELCFGFDQFFPEY